MNLQNLSGGALSSEQIYRSFAYVLTGATISDFEADPIGHLGTSTADILVEIFKGLYEGKYEIEKENISLASASTRPLYTDRGHIFFRKSLLTKKMDVAKNWTSRRQIYGISCVIEKLFNESIIDDFEIMNLRKIADISINLEEYDSRKKAALFIKSEVESLIKSNRRLDGITFSNITNSPIIKTNQAGFLSKNKSRALNREIEGVYSIYRRAFVEDNKEVYIREVMELNLHNMGMTVHIHSGMKTDSTELAVFSGVAFFVEKQVWILIHNPDVYTKMRVGLANLQDWSSYLEQYNNKEAASFQMLWKALGMNSGVDSIISTKAIVKKEQKSAESNVEKKSVFYSPEEIKKILSPSECKNISDRIEI